jgi:cytochrome c oxidase cbb3-type subunit III
MATDTHAAREDALEERAAGADAAEEARAKREIKAEQDRLAFGDGSHAALEWDGIRKLDYPPPRWWVLTFWATFVFAVLWWILYPSWPGTSTYFPGILGYQQRVELERQTAPGRAEQAARVERIAALGAAGVAGDPALRAVAVAGGEVLFKENCAGCHALGGAGQRNFPSLADDDWIWGGTLADIEHTIRHGVRNGESPEARDSMMPAFGADGLLTREQIADVTQHVLSLTGRAADPAAAERGAAVYAENCAACHGEGGAGAPEQGAPALNDAIWLYGGTAREVAAQIARPRLGVMPPWQGRLDEGEIAMLALYVHGLGGGR